MDVANIARLSTSMAETGNRSEVGLAVLKRAQEIQKTSATQMIATLEAVPQANNLPPHLGKTINTTA